ncbi:MAG: hypothetical protein K0S33_698 [Bacteroidetes bacterium]|jgi:energy-coupling factor transporter ATP-binding protein EcfA2|nr:hypothetical protein [Bacteroidota bacterium]
MKKTRLKTNPQQEEPDRSVQNQVKIIRSPFDYNKAIGFLEEKGRREFGEHFSIPERDHPIVKKISAYFLKDEFTCAQENLQLEKGILLTGPIGCGKTSVMALMKYFCNSTEALYIVKSCRDVSFEFIKDGYEVVHRYGQNSFYNRGNTSIPRHYCFDDLGAENNLKYFGNECNVMAEILLSRYDLFVSKKLITHVTTNLSASEIEKYYGDRVRSRMREQFNLISFDGQSPDKRK